MLYRVVPHTHLSSPMIVRPRAPAGAASSGAAVAGAGGRGRALVDTHTAHSRSTVRRPPPRVRRSASGLYVRAWYNTDLSTAPREGVRPG